MAGLAGPHSAACEKQGVILCNNSVVDGSQVRAIWRDLARPGAIWRNLARSGVIQAWLGRVWGRLGFVWARGLLQRLRSRCRAGVRGPHYSRQQAPLCHNSPLLNLILSTPQGSSMDFLMKVYLSNMAGPERVSAPAPAAAFATRPLRRGVDRL